MRLNIKPLLLSLSLVSACDVAPGQTTEQSDDIPYTDVELAQYAGYWLPGDVRTVVSWRPELGPVEIHAVKAEYECGLAFCRRCSAGHPCQMFPAALPPFPVVAPPDAKVTFELPPLRPGGFYLVYAKGLPDPGDREQPGPTFDGTTVVSGSTSLIAQYEPPEDATDVKSPPACTADVETTEGFFLFRCPKKNPPIPPYSVEVFGW